MKIKKIIILLSSIILMAAIVAAVVLYLDSRAETKFTTVIGTVHEYIKKVKEVKLENLGTNLALKMEAYADSFTQDKTSETATDSDVTTYWEGKPDSYPNKLTVNLKSVASVKALRIKLNPDTLWEKRKQTLSISSSLDDKAYKEIVASADYLFDPEENGNIITIKFDPVKAQYIKLNFTANTAATAGQVAEIEVY
jgi:hypothetical protein